MRKHFDNDGARDKVCLTLWIARSNIQTGDGTIFLLVKHSTLIMMWVALIPLSLSQSLSQPALALREKDGVGNRARAREREREMEREKERRNQIYS